MPSALLKFSTPRMSTNMSVYMETYTRPMQPYTRLRNSKLVDVVKNEIKYSMTPIIVQVNATSFLESRNLLSAKYPHRGIDSISAMLIMVTSRLACLSDRPTSLACGGRNINGKQVPTDSMQLTGRQKRNTGLFMILAVKSDLDICLNLWERGCILISESPPFSWICLVLI